MRMFFELAMGVEPINVGFADQCVKPFRHTNRLLFFRGGVKKHKSLLDFLYNHTLQPTHLTSKTLKYIMKNYAKLQKVFELPKLLTIFNINVICVP